MPKRLRDLRRMGLWLAGGQEASNKGELVRNWQSQPVVKQLEERVGGGRDREKESARCGLIALSGRASS